LSRRTLLALALCAGVGALGVVWFIWVREG